MINRPKITPEQLTMYTEPIVDIYRALEEDIFLMVANRLKTNADITSDTVLQWQIEKMNELRLINEGTVKALSKATGMAEREIRQAIKETGVITIDSVDHELKGVYPVLPKPSEMDRVLESYVNQTFREYDNFINQTLITSTFGSGTAARMYQGVIEETTAKMLSGTKNINQVLTETIVKWQNKGLASGFVDRAGRTWSVEAYSRAVITSTVNRTYREQRHERMKEYGVNTILVTSLPDPREICSKIQGKVATTLPIAQNNTEYPSIYEYGYSTPAGLFGINCRHFGVPYIPGANTNNQTNYSESEMKKNKEDRQRQRYLENQIRKAKKSLNIAETIGDEESIMKYKSLLRNRQVRIRKFIQETGRTRQYSREKVY